ncbi:MAG: type I secretion system permease/ATPase [Bradyrhizobiaceae bacterium]|nr:MAG: type I secretion system permease/ATPase [Bradyrhizobiaceae bacterium]
MNLQARAAFPSGQPIGSPLPDAAPVADAKPEHDSFSDALLFVAAHHGRAITRDALLSGLPIEHDQLTPNLFSRAAARAGLEVEATKRDLADIPSLVLPAVLIFHDRSTRVLMATDGETIEIINPSTRKRERLLIHEMERDYLGYAFLLRPVAMTTDRVAAAGGIPGKHWFWSVVQRFGANYRHVAIAALIVNMLALAAPLFVMNVYDRVVPNGAIPSLVALAIGLGLAIVFDFVLRTVRARIIDVTGKKIDVVLAAEIFEHILSIKMAQRPQSVGILANQMRDFDSVRDFFTSGTVVSATDLLFALIFIVVLFIIAGPLAWIPLAMLPIMILVGVILQRPLNDAVNRLQAESSARHGVLVESLSYIETVRATGAEAKMQNAWERSVAATARSGEDVHFWSTLSLTAASTAQQLTSMMMIVVGVFLILDGKLSMGALIASNMLAGRVLSPIAGIAAVITRATQTIVAMRSIDKLMTLERERPVGRTYIAREVKGESITFDNVHFKYPNASVNALDGVTFKINPGERVGIIGRIGSGKTTVGRLISGFYQPDEGRVLVDGVDLRQFDPADLRRSVGFVLQDTDLFFGKLRDNIALGYPAATDAEILEAARLAGVEQFAAHHPLGYDLPIAEGGRSLSGGQKQAIGLARALIRKPQVLFLDEPTAHFDTRSEAEFLERLKALKQKEMTIIVSTHRLSLLALVDRLLVFEQGKLIADGPRDLVIARLQNTATAQGAKPNTRPQTAPHAKL